MFASASYFFVSLFVILVVVLLQFIATVLGVQSLYYIMTIRQSFSMKKNTTTKNKQKQQRKGGKKLMIEG